MPNGIVTETCPAPECNLTDQDIERFVEEMTSIRRRYLNQLFSGRSNWNGARAMCRACWGMRRARMLSRWRLSWVRMSAACSILLDKVRGKQEPVIAIHQRLVGETLGEEDGVALIDELSVVKQGDDLVGVAAQYCGSVGKIANGQVGVYLGYASRKGYSLIEGQLFMPDEWFDEAHAEKRSACGVPEDLVYQTKPEIGLELLQKAAKRGDLPFHWVAADELYGDLPAFRDGVADTGQVVLHRDQMHHPGLECSTRSVCA